MFGQKNVSTYSVLTDLEGQDWFNQNTQDVFYLNDEADNARSCGYLRPYSAGSSYNFSAYFSPHILRHSVYNGLFFSPAAVNNKKQNRLGFQTNTFDNDATILRYYETRKTFYVPILSGCLGTLIPTDQWKLIPGAGCGQLLFEWRFNQHAFFASGPNYHSFDLYNNNERKGAFSTGRD